MDSIREPLLILCAVAVVGGLFLMITFIVVLVIRGAYAYATAPVPPRATEPPTSAPAAPPETP